MYAVMDGERVQEMRQERGLSRQEFAREAGVAVSTVGKVERGGAAVRLKTARGIGAALGIDPKSIGRPVLRDREKERYDDGNTDSGTAR